MFEFPKGDANADCIYLQVGRVLSAFEFVEFNLGMLFACALSANENAASHIWTGIRTVSARLEVLKSAIEASSSPSLRAVPREAIFEALRTVSNTMTLRNNVAHGVVTEVTHRDGTIGYLLLPSSAKRQQSPFDPAYCYTADDLAGIDRDIDATGVMLARTFSPIYTARTRERAAELQRRDPVQSSQ